MTRFFRLVFQTELGLHRSIHQAYMPIVAGSTRASTLHYCCNDKAFAWGPVGAKDHLNNGALAQAHSHEGTHMQVLRRLKSLTALIDEHYGQKSFIPQVLLIDAGGEWNCHASDSEELIVFCPPPFLIYDLKSLELCLSAMVESFPPNRALFTTLFWKCKR